jgi:myo-inositol 2-dehydrogenase / D-chiro-inositol 1-dehydrogenase
MTSENVTPASTTRRDFLATATTTSAAIGAASFLSRSVHAAGSDIIKVGLVGCGGRGNGAAKDAMNADAGCRLTAIADVFYERLEDGKSQLKNVSLAGMRSINF